MHRSTNNAWQNIKYPRNLVIGHLNINPCRNKIVDARETFPKLQLDYFVLSETKFDGSFPSAQFCIENFEIVLSLSYLRESAFVIAFIGHPAQLN